jgi:hypothetical protein
MATDAQIKIWKAKHKHIYEIEVLVGDENEKATGYFKKPDLKVISAAAKFADSDPIRSGMIMFNECVLEADERISEDDEAKLAVVEQLGKLFRRKVATIKKI